MGVFDLFSLFYFVFRLHHLALKCNKQPSYLISFFLILSVHLNNTPEIVLSITTCAAQLGVIPPTGTYFSDQHLEVTN